MSDLQSQKYVVLLTVTTMPFAVAALPSIIKENTKSAPDLGIILLRIPCRFNRS
jgi:hypothetical protein